MKKIISIIIAAVLAIPVMALADSATSTSGLLMMPGYGGSSASSTGTSGLQMTGGLQMPGYASGTPSGLQMPEVLQYQGSGQYQSGPRLIQLDGDSTVYWVSSNNIKIPMFTAAVFLSYGNKWEDIATVGQDEFDSYQDAKFIWLNGGGGIYKIDGTAKSLISIDAWAAGGVDPSQIINVNKLDFNSYQTGDKITDPAELAN